MNGILIVDDDQPLLRAAARTLRSQTTVLTATEPNEARQLSVHQRPELAIVDVVLGEHDGVELIGQLKAERPELIVVAYSGHLTNDVAVASCIEAGASLVEPKTRSLREVVRLVEMMRGHDEREPNRARGRRRASLPEEIRRLQERRIREAMERHDRNVAAVARELGVGRAFVHRVLRRLT